MRRAPKKDPLRTRYYVRKDGKYLAALGVGVFTKYRIDWCWVLQKFRAYEFGHGEAAKYYAKTRGGEVITEEHAIRTDCRKF